MNRTGLFARGACITALMLVSATPALAAGKHERAEAAIARAAAKIDAANKIGATGEVPGMVARAQAELAAAREDLHRGDKTEAFDRANHAGMVADTALGEAHRAQTAAARDATDAAVAGRNDAEAAASAAQDAAVDANDRAHAAEMRANSAQAAAASAEAQADAMRNAPQTTVTVQKSQRYLQAPSSVRRAPVRRRTTVVHRAPARVSSEESTTVTTTPTPAPAP